MDLADSIPMKDQTAQLAPDPLVDALALARAEADGLRAELARVQRRLAAWRAAQTAAVGEDVADPENA